MQLNDIKKIDNYEQADILSALLKLMWDVDPKASKRSESIWDKEIMLIDSLLAEWNDWPFKDEAAHCTDDDFYEFYNNFHEAITNSN
tara:strand:- start:208 stop:468 length:261 start_codon:yes stop_codon:yes gene_type:complete